MNIYTENHSSFPKVDERLLLKKTLDKFDKGKLSWEGKEAEIRETKCRVVQAQVSAGLDVVTDGMVRWQDEISYLMPKFYGVELGGLSRWFDTNFYYRVPLIKSEVFVMPYTLSLKDSVEFPEINEKITKSIRKKLILTGPYTLAKMSINKGYKHFENLVYDLSMFMKIEIEYLISKGFIVQINEPAITKHPKDKSLFLSAMQKLFSNCDNFDKNIVLSTYFGGVEFMLKELIQDVNCGSISLDLVEGPNQIEILKDLRIDKDLHLGIMEARTTKLEDCEYYAKWLFLFDKIGFKKDIYVGPNNGLEFLPWDKAESKLKNMIECVNEYKEKR
ncbi:MAG: hypothetical protein KAW92_11725 [Candidatus Cloacimonetes bacterium]|nr:hypothetical protein [Candidatus Cloacimonadota bacterium]